MIHEEIYHTCDRCGVKIKPLRLPFTQNTRVPLTIDRTCEKTLTELTNSVIDEVDKNIRCPTVELTIRTKVFRHNDTLELCKDCRKEFEKFMRGE
jgi:hypothetical protein